MSDLRPPQQDPADDAHPGRLTARAHPPVASTPAGLVPLTDADGGPLAMVYAPEPAADGAAYRLVVLLHGAGGSARQGLDLLLPVADAYHLLLVAPKASASSWDLIAGGFGVDVRRIDRLLGTVFDGYPVRDVTFGGFSDGASYALSLGLANGDLVDAVLAFSPGFAAPPVTRGRPRIFVSHGVDDRVLPIDMCSRRFVPHLDSLGYDVTYEEFPGGHEIPALVRQSATAWLTAPR
ncbi:phospholipase [Micromonospora acroterricola]|uniref:Phospholipase n=1 Tax=Micromonospora acroterricola TaxID=2202421 RepID=A0A317DFJ5_9ACTN|nr:phospholipase [Micromonospora acroterricola]PWR13234.1 phospholipase [Micromonospora acroterricola]